MSTILTVYSYRAFKRFLLPAINDADYSLLLSESLFDIPGNVELKLEVINEQWHFVPSEEYSIERLKGDAPCYNTAFAAEEADNQFRFMMNGQHLLSFIVRVTDDYFSEYTFYDISKTASPVTIGRDSSNMICYDSSDLNLVSSEHALMIVSGDQCVFEDCASANGSFVNNERVEGGRALSFGDCIDIFGLRIVYLGRFIAVNVQECGARIDRALQPVDRIDAAPLVKPNHAPITSVFHRSPRRIARITTETVKIDDPPAPKDEVGQMSLLAVIGSSLSMALPMLLGCGFMVMASRLSGVSRGAFMYIGAVTSVVSAVIGVFRSISGSKKARAEYEDYERLRNERYGQYLHEQEEKIRDLYEKNSHALRDRYASAEECCSYNISNPLLWSRNADHEDFLAVRLGTGDLPAQFSVEVPELKFSMTDNNLLEIPSNIRKTYSVLKNVPVCVDLLDKKLIGLIGGRKKAGAIQAAQSIIAQVAANNAYTDVKLAIVYDNKSIELTREWDFCKWLPHVWNETKSFRYIASNKEEASEVFYELCTVLRRRAESSSSLSIGRDRDNVPHPYYILLVVSPELLEGELINKYITNPEPAYGMTTIYMTERYEQLPNECRFIIQNDDSFTGMYQVSDDYADRTVISFDRTSTQMLRTLSESIANIEIPELESGGDIPSSVSFLEMYGARRLEDLNVLNRWRKNRTYESMKALVGQKAGGALCYLDIHEKYHGPHGLVAGTTGSGKSETLQTYILSLSVNFSPDDVAFFIIDYKGGGMANLFNGLPHMIGQISNLSANQVSRALVSIQSEKDRRESIFAECGVKDIRDYTKLYKNHEVNTPLPHLIIVIDEFAELKQEEPEFIQEIISLSRVGRSLGIHLIMSTQKPSGTVSPDIWANSRFKLCLRVQSREDSMDMLHKPDAAYLLQSGRSYLQVGNDELYELFQSGYSGAVYDEDAAGYTQSIAVLLDVDGRAAVEGSHTRIVRQREKKVQWIHRLLRVIEKVYGNETASLMQKSKEDQELVAGMVLAHMKKMAIDYPDTERNRDSLLTLFRLASECGFDEQAIVDAEAGLGNAREKLPQQPERSQLEAIVSYLDKTATDNGFTYDFSLFLPLLSDTVYLADLPEGPLSWSRENVFDGNRWPEHRGKWKLETPLGLYDDPANQKQDILGFDFSAGGSLLLFGSSASGKSTFLQTLVYGLVNRYSPAEVNLYILEYSARKFSVFENMPHVGGVIKDGDSNDRVDKFFMMLFRLANERKQFLGNLSFAQYIEIHGIDSVPAVVIIIDNIASLFVKTGEHYKDLITRLLKEGVNIGVYFVVSALGTGMNEIPTSFAQNFRSVICLELNNRDQYSNYLRVPPKKLTPEAGVKGRGIAPVGDRVLEFQTALPIEEENELAVNDRIEKLGAAMSRSWTGGMARQIPEIPEKPVWSDFAELQKTREMLETDRLLPLGYDALSADPYGIDLAKSYVYLISGGKKKGKTNALKVLMMSAAAKGGRLVIIDFVGEFRQIGESLGAAVISGEAEWSVFLSNMLRNDILPRNAKKDELRRAGAEDEEIFSAMQAFEKIYIFIDDLPEFVRRMGQPAEEGVRPNLMPNMEMLVDKAPLHNVFWFVTLEREACAAVSGEKLFRMFTRDHKGMHLGGQPYTTAVQGMNFDNHPRGSLDGVKPAGRAALPSDNEAEVTEVVLPLVKTGQL